MEIYENRTEEQLDNKYQSLLKIKQECENNVMTATSEKSKAEKLVASFKAARSKAVRENASEFAIKCFDENIVNAKARLNEASEFLFGNIERFDKVSGELRVLTRYIGRLKIENALKERREQYSAVCDEFLARTSVNRLPSADCVVVLERVALNKFWDKKSHFEDGRYSLYAKIDELDVTEVLIRQGKVISVDGEYYKGIASDYTRGGSDYMARDWTAEAKKIVLKEAQKYAVDLFYLLSGLQEDKSSTEYEEAKNMLAELVSCAPSTVDHLPLYVFDSIPLMALVKERVVCAVAKIKNESERAGDDNLKIEKYIEGIYGGLLEREAVAKERRIKSLAMGEKYE